jgi:hypothetical protein
MCDYVIERGGCYGHITRVYPKVSVLSRNEIYATNYKHSLWSNTNGYGGKTH